MTGDAEPWRTKRGSYKAGATLCSKVLGALSRVILCGRFSSHKGSAMQGVPRILCEFLASVLFSFPNKD